MVREIKGQDVIVAGGGAAGLAAAFRLQRSGYAVRLLEASSRVGGALSSERRNGFLLDRGAIFLPTTHRRLLAIARDAGIADQLVPGGFVFALARNGAIHHLDADHPVTAFAKLQALSPLGKFAALRLAPEAFKSRKATFAQITEIGRYDTATLGGWATETLSDEVRDHLIEPAIRGIFAADTDEVSRVELLGMMALFGGATLVAFRDGMGSYAEQLARQLAVTVNAEVVNVEQRPDGAEVTWREVGGERTEHVAGCVIALPAQKAAAIRPDLDPWRSEYLTRVRRGKLVMANVALAKAPAGISAAYTMIPRSEHPFLGAIGCDHHKAPGRAPDGKGLLTLILTNAWCEQHYEDNDDSLAQTALDAAETLVPGTIANAEFVQINRWKQQYNPVGHYAQLGAFRELTAQRDRSVQLAGEYLSSPNLNVATASGEAAAAALHAALG